MTDELTQQEIEALLLRVRDIKSVDQVGLWNTVGDAHWLLTVAERLARRVLDLEAENEKLRKQVSSLCARSPICTAGL